MQKIIETLKQNLSEEIVALRKKRGSKFLFVDKDNIFALSRVYLFELLGKTELADQELLKSVINDLIKRRVLVKEPMIFSEYKLGEFTYFDISLKTFDNRVYSRGTSTNKMEAYAKCLGEVFERFTLNHYIFLHTKKIQLANTEVTDAEEGVMPYSSYPQATPDQQEKFSFLRIDKEDAFTCVKAKEIKTGQERWVSSRAFSLNYSHFYNEKVLINPTSNGAAAGHSLRDARDSALLEILHRHLFLKDWYQKRTCHKVVFKKDDKELRETELFKKYLALEGRGFKMHFVNLGSDAGVPSIACLLEKYGGWHMGAASKSTLYAACERALDEAMATFMWSCGRQSLLLELYIKNNLDNVLSDFLDEWLTPDRKIKVFSNSYFVKNFDKFFVEGTLEEYSYEKMFTKFSGSIPDEVPGPVFEIEYKTKLLADYDFFLVKFFAPETYHFPMEEIYTKPIVKNLPPPSFTKINPFP